MELQNRAYTITGRYDLRFMAGTYVLMPVGAELTDVRKLPLIVNEVTAFILEQLQHKPLTAKELLALLLQEYRVGEQEAEEALADLLTQMVGKTVLEEAIV